MSNCKSFGLSNDLERPLPLTPCFKITPFFDAEYLRNGMRYRQFQWNTNRYLHTPYSTVLFRMTLNDLGWLSRIFNGTKRRSESETAELLVWLAANSIKAHNAGLQCLVTSSVCCYFYAVTFLDYFQPNRRHHSPQYCWDVLSVCFYEWDVSVG